MASQPPKTSQAGSLSASFSEKLKVAGAKAARGDHKELNVAIIKATTSQFHVVPKEKHVRTLKLAVHPSRSRRDVLHIILELHRRLEDSTDWLTALKTLITLHRLMRESEPAFMEELVRYSESLGHTQHGGGTPGAGGGAPAPSRLFATDNFVDRTSAEGRFDFSEWVRAYGKYLEEQLSVYATLKWYVEQEAPGSESRMRSLGARDLLYQLPHLQRLQRRQLDCVPRGAAMHDPVVLFSLSLVVKESFKLYKAVSEGVINLADAFFEMEYYDATRGLEYYRESASASDALSGYYATIGQIDEIKRNMQLPKLSAPPADFLTSMEAYVAEAPRPVAAQGEAPMPAKKGAPLRRGKLMAPGVRRADSGSAAALAAAAAGASRDPGMVLAIGSGSGQVSTVSSPTAGASAASQEKSPGAAGDLLGSAGSSQDVGAAAPAPAPEAPPAQKVAPTPLDLLSGLDFSFGASSDAAGASGGAAPAPLSSNPFADMPAPAPASAPHAAAAMQPAPSSSSNPFGDTVLPSPAASGGFGGGSSGFEWSMVPAAAPQPLQQPSWGAAPAQQQYQQPQHPQQQQQPYHGAGMALPAPTGVVSDDPFASFGSHAPAAYGNGGNGQLRSSTSGGYWGPGAAPYGAGMPAWPVGASGFGNEMSTAALHDPFAALTGLPPKNSPGAAGNRPSPPRPGTSVFPGF